MNQQILQHLSEGLTIKEIAVKLFLSKAAIEKRIRKMKQEQGVKNNTELVVKWFASRATA